MRAQNTKKEPVKPKGKKPRRGSTLPARFISEERQNPIEYLGDELMDEIRKEFDRLEKQYRKEKMGKKGPPLLLNRVRFDALVECFGLGLPQEDSANLAGISWDSLYGWMRKGREDETAGKVTLFSLLIKALKRAESASIQRNLLIIHAAGKESWQSAAWYNERKRPKDFGRVDRLEHSGPEGKPIETNNNLKVGLTKDDISGEALDEAIDKFVDCVVKARKANKQPGDESASE